MNTKKCVCVCARTYTCVHFCRERSPHFHQILKVLHDAAKIWNHSYVLCAHRYKKGVWRLWAQNMKWPPQLAMLGSPPPPLTQEIPRDLEQVAGPLTLYRSVSGQGDPSVLSLEVLKTLSCNQPEKLTWKMFSSGSCKCKICCELHVCE